MTTRTDDTLTPAFRAEQAAWQAQFNLQADADAEQAAWLAADMQQHPDAYRPVNWRGLAGRIAYLAVLAVGLVFLLAGLWFGLTEPGPWAALAVVGVVFLFALMLVREGQG